MVLWDLSDGRELRRFESHPDVVWVVAISPDGRTVATGTTSGPVVLWDLAAGAQLTCLVGHAVPSGGASFLPDGRHFLSAPTDGDDTVALLWDLEARRPRRMLRGHGGHLLRIVSSPDGRLAATGSVDQTVRLWDLATGGEVRCYRDFRARVGALAFNPDGTKFISGGRSDATIIVWDCASWSEQRRMKHEGETILSLAVFPDGKRLASAAWDRTVRIWDITTGRELRRIHDLNDQGTVLSVSHDGTVLFAGWGDRVLVWDTRSGQTVARIAIPGLELYTMAVAPDDRRIAVTGFGDHTLRVLELPPIPEPSAFEEAQLLPAQGFTEPDARGGAKRKAGSKSQPATPGESAGAARQVRPQGSPNDRP